MLLSEAQSDLGALKEGQSATVIDELLVAFRVLYHGSFNSTKPAKIAENLGGLMCKNEIVSRLGR